MKFLISLMMIERFKGFVSLQGLKGAKDRLALNGLKKRFRKIKIAPGLKQSSQKASLSSKCEPGVKELR